MASVTRIQLAYNNVYVVDSGGALTTIDAGPDYDGATRALDDGIAGREVPLVVATHGHLDHAGLGRWWQRRGSRVAISRYDAHLARTPQLTDKAEFAALKAYVHATGAPAEAADEVVRGLDRRRSWARDAGREAPHRPGGDGRWPTQLRYLHFEPDVLIADGSTLPGTGLEVVHCPGHTPGNLVLFHAEEGWLFSGDQLLPGITPTPAIQEVHPEAKAAAWRFPSLPRFLDSMHRIRALQPAYCWPGHGEPFGDVVKVIDENIGQIEQRTAKVAAALRTAGRVSVFELSDRLYPRALRRRFWPIIATVQGHLDVLVERGEAAQEEDHYVTVG